MQQMQKVLVTPDDYRRAAKKLDDMALKNITGVTIKDEDKWVDRGIENKNIS